MLYAQNQTKCAPGVLWSKRAAWILALLLLAPLGLSPAARADTLDRIRTTGALTLGYHDGERPFSYKDEAGQPAGFSVVLCQKVADEIKTELNLPSLTVKWEAVPIEDRFVALQQGRIDLLCGGDTVSLSGRKDASFSLPIYPSGVGAIMRVDAPSGLREILEGKPATGAIWRGSPARILNQRTIAVVKDSTAAKWVDERIHHFQLDVTTLAVENYAAGVAALTDARADVFFGDLAILVEAAANQLADGSVVELDRRFTTVALALAMARDNDNLRLIVDRALSKAYTSPEFLDLFAKYFGAPSAEILLFYEIASLPD